MNISLPDPGLQTILFEIIIILLMIASAKLLVKHHFLDQNQTDELKGVAILTVIFSHIGFFIFDNQDFLKPMSWISGAGVNLFLFVSGYGLTLSAIARPMNIINFYRKRLLRLFIPLWITITTFFLLDKFMLQREYTQEYLVNSYLGFFPSADLFKDLNSPLWYFTVILFFYLIFPLATWGILRYAAPFIIAAISKHILTLRLEIKEDVLNLYHLHYLAFPLGMSLALLKPTLPAFNILKNPLTRLAILVPSLVALNYYAVNAGVGTTLYKEHIYALLNMVLLILIVWALPYRFRLLSLFGKFSFELYLIHWPIITRYTDFYATMPAVVATVLYLVLLLGLSYLLQRLVRLIPT